MRVLDVRCYAARPDENDPQGSPPIVAMAVRVLAMHFTFRLPLPLAEATSARLHEAAQGARRMASPGRAGEGGRAAEPEGPEGPALP